MDSNDQLSSLKPYSYKNMNMALPSPNTTDRVPGLWARALRLIFGRILASW